MRSALDMLLQSWGNKIRLFPALPDAWTDVSFHNLRAEGAFLVSASRQKGKTKFVSITSLAGEPCVVKTDLIDPIIYGEKKDRLQLMKNNEYRLFLKKGETVVLMSRNDRTDFSIRPLPSSSDLHFWGGK